MSIEADADKDRAVELGHSVPWHIIQVDVLPDYTVKVAFSDGTSGLVRLRGLIQGEQPGVFSALRDKAVFEQAYLDFGAVTWPGEIDIAPDAMYDEIKARGEWVLE